MTTPRDADAATEAQELWDRERLIAHAEGLAADYRLGLDGDRAYRLSRDILRFVEDVRQQDARRIAELEKKIDSWESHAIDLQRLLDSKRERIAQLEAELAEARRWKPITFGYGSVGTHKMSVENDGKGLVLIHEGRRIFIALNDHIRLCRIATKEE